jgi:hypothetical protein
MAVNGWPRQYWTVVFVQMMTLVFFVSSWIPVWRLRSWVAFNRRAVNGGFFSPLVVLPLMLFGGIAQQLSAYFLQVDEGTNGRSYTVVYALQIAQMAMFSVWLVPYAARREAWWSLALLAVCAALGLATEVLVAVPVTGSGVCVLALVALVGWTGSLLLVVLYNLVVGGAQLWRLSLGRRYVTADGGEDAAAAYEHIDDADADADSSDAPTTAVSNSPDTPLVLNFANPVRLVVDLLSTLAG